MYNRNASKSVESAPTPATRWSLVLAPVGLFLLFFSRGETSLLAWGLGLTFATLMLARQEKSIGAALLALLGLAVLMLRVILTRL